MSVTTLAPRRTDVRAGSGALADLSGGLPGPAMPPGRLAAMPDRRPGPSTRRRRRAVPRPVVGRTAPRPDRQGDVPPLRLTRRGRLVVAVLGAAAVALVTGGAHATAAARQPAADRPTSVVVRPGESLWQVAVRAEPRADPRVAVADLQRRNRLNSTVVHAGDRLLLPAS